MEMGGWPFKRLRCEGFGKNILKIFIMCGYDGVRRGNYFGGEPIIKIEVEES